jgi:hypothetical protein
MSANPLASRVIQTDGTSNYAADVVTPAMGGQQKNDFSWQNVLAGLGQVVRVEELIYPQGDIRNYGLNVAIGPPPPPPPPPQPMPMQLPPIEAHSLPEGVLIASPSSDDSVSNNIEVLVVATSDPYVAVDGSTHPMPLVAHALYGYKDEAGMFITQRLLRVHQESYTENGQRRKYKFAFKRTQGDFDAGTRNLLGVVVSSEFGFVTEKRGPQKFPYSARVIKLQRLQT